VLKLIGKVSQGCVMDGSGMQNKHWMSSQKRSLLRLVTIWEEYTSEKLVVEYELDCRG